MTDPQIVTSLDNRSTAATGVAQTPVRDSTRLSAVVLTETADDIRKRVRSLGANVGETHQQAYQHEWQVLTRQRSVAAAPALLEDLANLGFSWRDIARLVGVSVPSIQKWRKGEPQSGENRRKLASLLAACDLMANHYYVEEIAQWFEMPIVDTAPVTPLDLWAADRQMLVFEYVGGALSPIETMDSFDHDWSAHYQSDFETFTAEDGNLSIRMRDR